ncbi:phospholipase D-like domain-containing protein [Desulfurivibrio sp. D14AmB]|uniref:phospholipase D-like domain-containing protein n=1 Tax=Desulfurivibrio sp. D14AmB TaxID=3374370 RepID=UPI00376EA6AA
MKALLIMLLLIWCLGTIYGLRKALPPGISSTGPWRDGAGLIFLYDLSYGLDGRRVHEERIVAAMLAEIARAEQFIVVDMFLFNRWGAEWDGGNGLAPGQASPVERVTGALLAARQARPRLAVMFIADEVNTGYGSYSEPHLARLAAHGVEVVITDLSELRDSNPIYSGLWRPLLQWWRPVEGRGRLPNPFAPEAPAMGLASWLKLLNFKANHRKLLLTERAALVSSGNIHDASARHSNIAFLASGEIIGDLLAGELAVARFSGHDSPASAMVEAAELPGGGGRGRGGRNEAAAGEGGAAREGVKVRMLGEGAIRRQLLAALQGTQLGDLIWMGQFYLADRRVMAALAAAARRGVEVRLILDPNRDAFGRDKRGIPNRQSAARLLAAAGDRLRIRWYDTRGEQFHVKLTMVQRGDRAVIIGGSANLTRRNLADYNLETCLEIRAGVEAAISVAVADFFARLWDNRAGEYTLDYSAFAERSTAKAAWAAWQEFSGMGTF